MAQVPNVLVPFVDLKTGRITREWLLPIQSLITAPSGADFTELQDEIESLQGLGADVAALEASVAALNVPRAQQIEVDLGDLSWTGSFVVTDSSITPASRVIFWQAAGPYSGKGVRADEAELQPVSVIYADPTLGSVTVKWQTPPIVTGPIPTRLGKIGGYVKFNYQVSQ